MPDVRPSFWRQTALIFGLLGVALLPFPFKLFRLPARVSDAVFGPVVSWIERVTWGQPANFGISSDTRGLVVLMGLLLALAVGATVVIRRRARPTSELNALLYSVICGYIALILLKYGFDKITKSQFPLPEPNTLYTPFGYMPKDLLYWSVIGLSRPYNIATGLAEVLAALLILSRRTRVLGLCVSALLMAHIVLLNVCFEISVKAFSMFLLGLHVAVLWPQGASMWRFFVSGETAQRVAQPESVLLHGVRWRYLGLKTFVVCCFFIEALYPQLHGHPFNDDAAPRPPLHGAYAVLPPDGTHKRLFFHRNLYLIFQQSDDTFTDYKLSIDTLRNTLQLTDDNRNTFALRYYVFGDTLRVSGYLGHEHLDLKALPLDWRSLPANTSW